MKKQHGIKIPELFLGGLNIVHLRIAKISETILYNLFRQTHTGIQISVFVIVYEPKTYSFQCLKDIK